MKINDLCVKNFLEKLEIVGNAINNNPEKEYLKDVKIVANEKAISLLTCDNLASIKTFLINDLEKGYDLKEEGKIIVDFKLLKTLFSKLNCNYVNMMVENNSKLIIESDNGIYKLSLDDYNSYPDIKFEKNSCLFKINKNELKDVISKTIFATSNHKTKMSLTGVNFQLKKDLIQVIATDSIRLSQYKINLENDKIINLLFPKQSLVILDKIISKSNKEEIVFSYNESTNEIIVEIDKILYKSRLMLELFPNCEGLIKNNYIYTLEIDRKELINSIERIDIFSQGEEIPIILLKISKDKLIIANVKQNFENAYETLKCKNNYELDEEMKIYCSSRNILEALKCFSNDEIVIEINKPIMPFNIKEKNSDKVIELLLPIKYNNN